MKRHVALTLLIVTALGVINAHVDLPQVDGRRFVATQGQTYDPVGWLQDQLNAWRRHCNQVETVALHSAAAQEVMTRIGAFSPPDSHTARALSLLRAGPWWLAEVSFESLSPAVVVLHGQGQDLQIVERAIWSGSTSPWRPAPRIRQHLQAGTPDLPANLLACLEPQSALFRP